MMPVVDILLTTHTFIQYTELFHETSLPAVPAYDDTVQQDLEPLPNDMLDSLTLMMVSDDTKVWNFGFLIFGIQFSLVIAILVDPVLHRKTSIPVDAPREVPAHFVIFAQFILLFMCTFWQSDILISINVLDIFWFNSGNENGWAHEEIHAKDGTPWI